MDDCWAFPDVQKIKVKIQNKKMCHLYPEEKKILKPMEPQFEACKTLYTKCDFKLEQCVHEQIIKLEKELREFLDNLSVEMKFQNKVIDEMWTLSQRYLILTRSGVCVKIYPEIISGNTEERILCKFTKKTKALNFSNCRMGIMLNTIRESIMELDRRCDLLDMTVDSIFIKGNHYQKPLAYVREVINDIFRYFFGVLCKLQSWAQLIDPGDAVAIEDYSALVKPSDDFENFLLIGMEHCKCMRTKNPNCLDDFVNECT